MPVPRANAESNVPCVDQNERSSDERATKLARLLEVSSASSEKRETGKEQLLEKYTLVIRFREIIHKLVVL